MVSCIVCGFSNCNIENVRAGENQMDDINRIRLLKSEVLREVVREAERKVDAQFTVHLASTQRSLIVAGFTFTAGSGVFGAYMAFFDHQPNLQFYSIILCFMLGMALSSIISLISSLPMKFSTPGNDPLNWLPEKWELGKKRSIHQSLYEQAKCLQSQISENRASITIRSHIQIIAYAIIFLTIVVCVALLSTQV